MALVVKNARRIAILPTTRLGWWSLRLAAAHVVLVLAWRVQPWGAALGFAVGLVGGVVALVAIFPAESGRSSSLL